MESVREEVSGELRARFEALVHTVAEPLRKFLVRRTDADTADEVLADTLLVLWRRVDELPMAAPQQPISPDEVLPWCYGVARGCLANAQRSARRRARLKERLARMSRPLPADSTDHSGLYQALKTLRALNAGSLLTRWSTGASDLYQGALRTPRSGTQGNLSPRPAVVTDTIEKTTGSAPRTVKPEVSSTAATSAMSCEWITAIAPSPVGSASCPLPSLLLRQAPQWCPGLAPQPINGVVDAESEPQIEP